MRNVRNDSHAYVTNVFVGKEDVQESNNYRT